MMSYPEKMEEAKIKQLNRLAVVVSVLIPTVVLVLMTPGLLPKLDLPFSPYVLPPFYTTVNGITAVVLLLALYFVKKKRIDLHQKMIYLSMALSFIFLVGYITYHLSADPTSYTGEMKTVYYTLLISHILLSAIITPFVLFTFVRGYTGQVEKHRKLAKVTFPLWLYVVVSGVICYLMLASDLAVAAAAFVR